MGLGKGGRAVGGGRDRQILVRFEAEIALSDHISNTPTIRLSLLTLLTLPDPY